MGKIKVHEEDLWAVQSGLKDIIAIADLHGFTGVKAKAESILSTVYAMLNRSLRE